jgi:cation:H+ antiporter
MTPTLLLFCYLILGLVLIVAGANFLVDGSSFIARKFKISEFVVGLTIVGMGTSTPELVVSMISGIQGSGDIAIGNVVGSNIANIFLILGMTALISPIGFTKANIKLDLPICIATSMLLLLLSFDTLFFGQDANVIGRIDSIILLLGFIAFMIYSFKVSGNESEAADSEGVISSSGDKSSKYPILKAVAKIVAGLAGLILGGRLFVDSGSEMAAGFGVSEAFIGITVMAVGTSLPELAASVVAAMKKKGQMALGNIVGSNIFNILFILGTCSMVTPLTLGGITLVDVLVMIAAPVFILFAAFTPKKRVMDRWEGLLFLIIYLVYIVYLTKNL